MVKLCIYCNGRYFIYLSSWKIIFFLHTISLCQEIYFSCTKYYVTSKSASDKYKENTIKNSCNEIYPRSFNKCPRQKYDFHATGMCNNYYEINYLKCCHPFTEIIYRYRIYQISY